jgi:hypothetical protein
MTAPSILLDLSDFVQKHWTLLCEGIFGLLGFLSYEGFRIYKRGGIARAIKSVGWWYAVIFLVNSAIAAALAIAAAFGNLWLAWWLGVSVPATTGIFFQPRRKAISIDDVSIGGVGANRSLIAALRQYYRAMN